MNPYTNRFERLQESPETQAIERQLRRLQSGSPLVRPDGSPVPEHWSVYQEGEHGALKNYTFKVAHIGESYRVLEPVGPVLVGQEAEGE